MQGYYRITFIILMVIGILAGCSQPNESTKNTEQNVEKAPPKQEQIESGKTKQEDTVEAPEGENLIQGIDGKVLSVTDGDTIKVQLNNGNTEKVRMILIDTPETKHPRLGAQPFGKEASNFTTKELTDKNVTLELDVEERDQYGRLLAYVWVKNVLFNEKLIEEGLARVAVYPPNTKYVDRFREVQSKAQSKGMNIWSIEDYAQNDGYNTDTSKETPAVPSNESESNSNSGNGFFNDPSDDKEANLGCSGKIKGNANSKIYHVPGGSYYDSTTDNIVWFCTGAEAESAGYRKSKR